MQRPEGGGEGEPPSREAGLHRTAGSAASSCLLSPVCPAQRRGDRQGWDGTHGGEIKRTALLLGSTRGRRKGGMCADLHAGTDTCEVPLGRHVRKPHPGGVVASQRGLSSSFSPSRVPHPEECQTSDVFFSCRCYRSQCPGGEMSEVIILWWVCRLLHGCQLLPQCWGWGC